MLYGNVMGSFAIEGYGIERFLALSLDDIEDRYQTYRRMTIF